MAARKARPVSKRRARVPDRMSGSDAGRSPDTMDKSDLTEIAFAEISRRLKLFDEVVQRATEYETALTRAAQLIDFATDRQINPEDYQGEIREMLHEHQAWIEAQRRRGLFPALHGTKPPVAQPKQRTATWHRI